MTLHPLTCIVILRLIGRQRRLRSTCQLKSLRKLKSARSAYSLGNRRSRVLLRSPLCTLAIRGKVRSIERGISFNGKRAKNNNDMIGTRHSCWSRDQRTDCDPTSSKSSISLAKQSNQVKPAKPAKPAKPLAQSPSLRD